MLTFFKAFMNKCDRKFIFIISIPWEGTSSSCCRLRRLLCVLLGWSPLQKMLLRSHIVKILRLREKFSTMKIFALPLSALLYYSQSYTVVRERWGLSRLMNECGAKGKRARVVKKNGEHEYEEKEMKFTQDKCSINTNEIRIKKNSLPHVRERVCRENISLNNDGGGRGEGEKKKLKFFTSNMMEFSRLCGVLMEVGEMWTWESREGRNINIHTKCATLWRSNYEFDEKL